jgi:DNA-binding transcriptional ArsR family regulator
MTETPSRAAAVDADATFDALGSRVPREILIAASRQPTTAEELAERCEVSESTIYRHLNRLVEAGLVRKEGRSGARTAPTYRTVADSLAVTIDPDGIAVHDDRTDEFERALRTVLAHLDVRRVEYDAADDAVDVSLGAVHQETSELVDLCRRLLLDDRDPSDAVEHSTAPTDIVSREN